MQSPSFEIKIPILGYVSAGKSTILNALLQGKYSEVAMRRTTAGVTFFRLKAKAENPNAAVEGSTNPESTNETDPEHVHTAAETLEKITKDNAFLRKSNIVQESMYDIEVNEPLCAMRSDTKLVLIDVPGLNEAGSNEIYREYVTEKWDTYDCVIAVMDVFQGVNTEEQVQLLKLIRKNLKERKQVPVIVLCNKVDDLENEEVMMLVNEIKTKVVEMFQNKSKKSSAAASTPPSRVDMSFFPISAESAFVYRTAASLSFEDFQKLDKDLIEKLGKDEVGKSKWRRLSKSQRYELAYKCVSADGTYGGSLESENFTKFLDKLSQIIGGNDTQVALINKQLDVALLALASDKHIANSLKKIYDAQKHLGIQQNTADYAQYFTNAYTLFLNASLQAYESDMSLKSLQDAMQQLIEYDSFLGHIGSLKEEHEDHIPQMVKLIQAQILAIVKHFEASNLQEWLNNPMKPNSGNVTWSHLTPHDFLTICQSILLLSYSKSFCAYLGQEKTLLEHIVHDCIGLTQRLDTKYDSIFGNLYNGYYYKSYSSAYERLHTYVQGSHGASGEFVPANLNMYKCVVQIEMPRQLSDPAHWGHLAWLFCEFMETYKMRGATSKKQND